VSLSSLLMRRRADVVHVTGDVCRRAPWLRKPVVSTVIYLLSTKVSNRIWTTDIGCLSYLFGKRGKS